MADEPTYAELKEQNAELHARLLEAEETLRAISAGEVDAFVISTPLGPQIFALQSADHPYRLLVEEMQQAAVTTSLDGTILYCNRRFAEILGYPSDQLTSQQIDQYIAPGERESFQTFRQTASSGNDHEQEFNLRHQPSQDVPVLVVANMLPLEETKVICLIITDLRQQKQAEQQAIELGIERQRIRLLADFVSNTSHDLRTPITIILSGLSNLARIEDMERRREKVQQVESYALYLNRVLEQLQEMAVLDSITELVMHPGKINMVIQEAVRSFERKAMQKDITVSIKLASDVPRVRFDADTLYRALSELMENAVRFVPTGGEIQVRAAPAQDDYEIEVANNGPDIDSESSPHIFERFFKADESRSLTGGAGLGLPIVKRIVELHHGSIEVSSAPDTETVFRIRLPVIGSHNDVM